MAEKVEKERLDVLLVQRGLAPGRDQAKAYIMAGNVYVDGMKEDKAGTKIPVTAEIEVRDAAMKYVSRGGYKLEKAMEVFPITLTDKICLDIGASTRFHRLYAAKRRCKGIFHRRWLWSICLETAQ